MNILKTNIFLGYIDVYEFAKTVWMILTEKRFCFSGEYNRERKDIFLTESAIVNNDYTELETLEPLHEFLELSTKDNIFNRPDINRCYFLLNELIEANKSAEKIKKYNLIGLGKDIKINSKPDGYKYFNLFEIVKNIKAISNIFFVELPQYNIKISITDCIVKNEELRIIGIIDDLNNEYLIGVNKLEINYDCKEDKEIDNVVLDINNIELEIYNGYENIENLQIFPGILFNNRKIFLNINTIIKFSKKKRCNP